MNTRQQVLAQFGHPQGWLGYLAGLIMANRSSNILRNEWTLALLDLQLTDRVLEVGFGPGVALQKTAQTVGQGCIVGLDHSAIMLSQASHRNAAALAEGRIILMLGSLAALSTLTGPFDKIYSVNVFMFWDDPVGVCQTLKHLLAPGGILATTLQPRGSNVSDQQTILMGDRIAEALCQAGFARVRRETKRMKPASAVCVLATKEADEPFSSSL